MKIIYTLAKSITKLEGGSYNVETIVKAIQTFTDWALRIGITLAGVSLLIGFIIYATASAENKHRVKGQIIQTLFGIAGIILSLSLVNLIIDLFA